MNIKTVIITVKGSPHREFVTLDEFLSENADDEETVEGVTAAMAQGVTYYGGGGAAPEFEVAAGPEVEAATPLPIGTRVSLTKQVENWPIGRWEPGETGTLIDVDPEYLTIKMDRHFPELDEWENDLQVHDGFRLNGPEARMWNSVEAIA